MKRDRSSLVDVDSALAAENNSQPQAGYDAYFGTYTIDDARGTVTQTLTGALAPENVGQVVTRDVTIVDDALTIQLQTKGADGEAITRTLKWTRIG